MIIPRPSQVARRKSSVLGQVRCGSDHTILEEESAAIFRVRPTLSCDHRLFAKSRLSCVDIAVLKERCGKPEYEIYCPVYVAFPKELPTGMVEERVLVALEATPVERWEISCIPDRHRLALAETGSVSERNVNSYESFSGNGCKMFQVKQLNVSSKQRESLKLSPWFAQKKNDLSWFCNLLTESRTVISGPAVVVATIPRDYGLSNTVTEQQHVLPVIRDSDVLLVHSAADVNHIIPVFGPGMTWGWLYGLWDRIKVIAVSVANRHDVIDEDPTIMNVRRSMLSPGTVL